MGLAIVQEAHDFNYGAARTPSVTTSQAVTKGDLLVLFCTSSSNEVLLLPDDGRNMWVVLETGPLAAGYGYIQAWYAIAESTRVLTIKVYGGGGYSAAARSNIAAAAFQFVEISGNSMNPLNVTADATGTSQAPAAGVTTTAANTIVLGFAIADTDIDTLTPAVGWTALSVGLNASGVYATESATGTYTPTFAQGNNAAWGCIAVAFQVPGTQYTISGALGSPGAGATVFFISETTGIIYTATADGSGNYVSPGLENDTYIIQPQLLGVVFPVNATTGVVVNGGNVTGKNFTTVRVNTKLSFTVLASDSMQRANENPLSNGGKWTTNNADPKLQLLNDECIMVTAVPQPGGSPSPQTGDGVMVWNVPLPANQFQQFRIDDLNSTAVENAQAYVCCRSNSGNTESYYLTIKNNGDGTCNLSVFAFANPQFPEPPGNLLKAGFGRNPYTFLTLLNQPFSLGDTYSLAAIDNTFIYVLHNGNTIGAVLDNTGNANLTGAYAAIVLCGLNTADTQISEFFAGSAAYAPQTGLVNFAYGGNESSETSISTSPINTNTGDILVVGLRLDAANFAGLTSITTSGGAVFTQVPNSVVAEGSTAVIGLWYLTGITGKAGEVITANFGSGISNTGICVWEVANPTSSPIDVVKVASSASANTLTTSAFSTSSANEVLLVLAQVGNVNGFFNSGTIAGSIGLIDSPGFPALGTFVSAAHQNLSTIQNNTTITMSSTQTGAFLISAVSIKFTPGNEPIGWSPVDSRVAVLGFGPGPNIAIVDAQGNQNYSLPGSQISSNSKVPGTDSRVVKPKDCRVSVPVNSRVDPDENGVEV